MNISILKQELNAINALRENRKRLADIVLKNVNLFSDLVTITFSVDDKISIKAAWVLEWICTHNSLNLLIPYLDFFTQNISKLKFDSAIRPCAKICEHLAMAYTSKEKNSFTKTLTSNQIDLIIETGFDWLITPQKIAVRAYSMNILYQLGLYKDWVFPELYHLIQSKIIHESKGCKARGKSILLLIDKHYKTKELSKN